MGNRNGEWRKSFGLASPTRSVSVGDMANGGWRMANDE